MSDDVEVRIYCGLFAGPPRWQSTEDYEPDECRQEGVMRVDRREWQEGCVSIVCSGCGAELYQTDDHFRLAGEKSVT